VADALDGDELAACFALRRASDRLKRVVARHLQVHALSEVQFSVLATLYSASHGRRMGDLAEALVVSKGGLTYQVAQLEDRGLVERVGAEDDDRSVIARLTDVGTAVVEQALPGHLAVVRESFLDLLDDEEVRFLGEVLGRVAVGPPS